MRVRLGRVPSRFGVKRSPLQTGWRDLRSGPRRCEPVVAEPADTRRAPGLGLRAGRIHLGSRPAGDQVGVIDPHPDRARRWSASARDRRSPGRTVPRAAGTGRCSHRGIPIDRGADMCGQRSSVAETPLSVWTRSRSRSSRLTRRISPGAGRPRPAPGGTVRRPSPAACNRGRNGAGVMVMTAMLPAKQPTTPGVVNRRGRRARRRSEVQSTGELVGRGDDRRRRRPRRPVLGLDHPHEGDARS